MAYFWYQSKGGTDPWREALSEHRAKVISEQNPAFMTVLDSHSSPDEDEWGREDYAKMKYSGSLYFDFDASDIADTIPPFLEFLAKLDEGGVNLKALRLYATGGRGFHCEIPEEMVNPKVVRTGVTLLPYLWREIALELAVDTMDLKVYTARKGRMWRCPNVERINKEGAKTGRYKVPITLEEALSMTPDSYVALTSAPRQEPQRELPTLSSMLASMFVKAQNKIEAQGKIRAKAKDESQILAKFNGDFPPTVLRLMNGEGVTPGIGFNKIAMQLAITANALGKTMEELVAACEGLVQKHSSDSDRYNSPRKRKEELRRMYEYTHDNPLYDFSVGGIKGLCAIGTTSQDLDSPLANLGVGTIQNHDEELPQELKDLVESSSTLLEGLVILKGGVYQRKPDGAKHLSNISFSAPNKLVDTEDYVQVGIEADVEADGIKYGRLMMPMQTFKSRATLNDFCTGRGAIYSGTDTQAGAIQLILTRNAVNIHNTTYIVRKEGIDIVQNPEVRDKPCKHTIWSSPDAVLRHQNDDGIVYRYQSKVSSGPVLNTDLLQASPLEDEPGVRPWLHAMLDMNNPVVVAQMLGWFVSCFHKQFYHAAYNQFPLLHPNGTAGSGKTQTTLLLAHMFWVTNPVYMIGASQNASSSFSLKSAFTASASIPVIIDEYKPSELGNARYDFLLQHFRMLYNQASGSSGGINRGAAESSFRDITHYTYSAPTVYLGESQEMQTAIVQRTVSVGFSSGQSALHTDSFNTAFHADNRIYMSRLGRLLLAKSLEETIESRTAALDPVRAKLRSMMDPAIHDRQVYNTAVVVCGLDFLGGALHEVFGAEFDDEVLRLRGALLEYKDSANMVAQAESSKVIADISLLSRIEVADTEFSVREGHEYIIGDGWMELMVRESFIKYFAWSTRKGFKPLYTTADAFIHSLAKSPMVVDAKCFDSKLRTSPASKIFRISLNKLNAEGIEMFKSKFLA